MLCKKYKKVMNKPGSS